MNFFWHKRQVFSTNVELDVDVLDIIFCKVFTFLFPFDVLFEIIKMVYSI